MTANMLKGRIIPELSSSSASIGAAEARLFEGKSILCCNARSGNAQRNGFWSQLHIAWNTLLVETSARISSPHAIDLLRRYMVNDPRSPRRMRPECRIAARLHSEDSVRVPVVQGEHRQAQLVIPKISQVDPKTWIISIDQWKLASKAQSRKR